MRVKDRNEREGSKIQGETGKGCGTETWNSWSDHSEIHGQEKGKGWDEVFQNGVLRIAVTVC